MEASEATQAEQPQQQEAPESGAEQQGQEQQSEELNPKLVEQFQMLADRLPQQQEESSDLSSDLFSEPEGIDEYEQFEDPNQLQELQQQYADPYGQMQDPNEAVQQAVAEAMQPIIMQQRVEGIQKVETELNLSDDEKQKVVSAMFETFGDGPEGLAFRTDPNVVKRFGQAVKAEGAAADEVPAEEAAKEGAAIETGAGPSNQGEENPDGKFKDAVFGDESKRANVPFLD